MVQIKLIVEVILSVVPMEGIVERLEEVIFVIRKLISASTTPDSDNLTDL